MATAVQTGPAPTPASTGPAVRLGGMLTLGISAAFAVFFLARAVGLNAGVESGPIAFGIAAVVLGAIAVRLLMSPRGKEYAAFVEDSGFLGTASYKRTQGLRLRRYTMAGIMLAGFTAVYALTANGLPGNGLLRMRMPFADEAGKWIRVGVLPDAHYILPMLLVALTVWVAWRTVNIPVFADFLIATEAEMNKVSWSSRKRLIQDTIVVLVTTVLLTLFLLAVDLFWGWLLSTELVGVLPQQPKTQQQSGAISTPW
jgi:preprotein translocase SecE subunit